MREIGEENRCRNQCPTQSECKQMIGLLDNLITTAENYIFGVEMNWQLRDGAIGPSDREIALASAFKEGIKLFREKREEAERVLGKTALRPCSGVAIMQDEDGEIKPVCRAGVDPVVE